MKTITVETTVYLHLKINKIKSDVRDKLSLHNRHKTFHAILKI